MEEDRLTPFQFFSDLQFCAWERPADEAKLHALNWCILQSDPTMNMPLMHQSDKINMEAKLVRLS